MEQDLSSEYIRRQKELLKCTRVIVAGLKAHPESAHSSGQIPTKTLITNLEEEIKQRERAIADYKG